MAEISTHPDYTAKQTEYIQQKAAADAARDEVMQQKAENAWLQSQMVMTQDLSSQETAKANKDAALAKMTAEYPAVPVAAYRHLADFAAMEEVGKEVAASLGTPEPAPVGGGAPGPVGGQPPTPKGNVPLSQDPKYLTDLQDRARANKPGAAEEVKKLVFKDIMLPSMARFGPAREEGIKKGVRR